MLWFSWNRSVAWLWAAVLNTVLYYELAMKVPIPVGITVYLLTWGLGHLRCLVINNSPNKIRSCVVLPAMNGAHSPHSSSLNGRTPSPPAMGNSTSAQQLPPACGARQLSKLKRFLTTLQQFGSDISPEIGERVRSLVLGLVVSNLVLIQDYSTTYLKKIKQSNGLLRNLYYIHNIQITWCLY